jgi:hypothetical protein
MLARSLAADDEFMLIEGEARGLDTIAKNWALKRGVRFLPFPAKWSEYTKATRWRAGHDRNLQMIVEGQPNMVVAFKDGFDFTLRKGGTENCVKQAAEHGLSAYPVTSLTKLVATPPQVHQLPLS